jgi:riboflavin kinase/FMN adenylyltransferase
VEPIVVEVAWSDLPDPEFRKQPAAITIGVFDGIHVGHRRLLAGITSDPRHLPVVVTFQRHPAEILATGTFPGFIMSLSQKRHLLREAGIGLSVLIDFSLEFSRVSGSEFLGTLVDSFALERAVIGHDFRCGHRMSMDAQAVASFLARHGVAVEIVPPVEDAGGIISSTRVRKAIAAGEFAEAWRMLGRPFTLDATDEQVEWDGPEAWIALDVRGLFPESSQLLPPPGRYRVLVHDGHETVETVATIGENSVRLPLAAKREIRYIVLQENRTEDKE